MAIIIQKTEHKQDRSPPFPFIGLTKAVERAGELFEKAKRFEVRLDDAGADWGFAPKSSATFQTVGALIAYGLLEDSGSGDNRKVKISDAAWHILEDGRPGVRAKLLAEAALKPKIIAEYAERWKDGRPDDAHCLSQLKFESKFTSDGAAKFLKVFDDTIAFTKGNKADKVAEVESGSGQPKVAVRVKVGDYVQWTSNGVDQFKPVRKVTKVENDHVWVFGSNTGIPMDQVRVTEPPAPKPVMTDFESLVVEPSDRDNGPPDDAHQIDVLMRGNRLQITADVDAAGLVKLKDILGKYEEILKLLSK